MEDTSLIDGWIESGAQKAEIKSGSTSGLPSTNKLTGPSSLSQTLINVFRGLRWKYVNSLALCN